MDNDSVFFFCLLSAASYAKTLSLNRDSMFWDSYILSILRMVSIVSQDYCCFHEANRPPPPLSIPHLILIFDCRYHSNRSNDFSKSSRKEKQIWVFNCLNAYLCMCCFVVHLIFNQLHMFSYFNRNESSRGEKNKVVIFCYNPFSMHCKLLSKLQTPISFVKKNTILHSNSRRKHSLQENRICFLLASNEWFPFNMMVELKN